MPSLETLADFVFSKHYACQNQVGMKVPVRNEQRNFLSESK